MASREGGRAPPATWAAPAEGAKANNAAAPLGVTAQPRDVRVHRSRALTCARIERLPPSTRRSSSDGGDARFMLRRRYHSQALPQLAIEPACRLLRCALRHQRMG